MSLTDVRAPHAASSQRPRTSPTALQTQLAEGTTSAAVTFAGQGVDALGELRVLAGQRPDLRPGLLLAADLLSAWAQEPHVADAGVLRHGFDVARWVDDPESAPDEAYLRSAAVSHPLILLAQALVWRTLVADGLDARGVAALAGHSQGVLAALMVSEAGGASIDDGLLTRWLRIAAGQGLLSARVREAARPGADGAPVTPMAAIAGVREARLRPVLDAVNADVAPGAAASLALINAPDRLVVSGAPATLALLHARLDEQAAEEEAARRAGRRGGAPLRFTWNAVAVDVPFHAPGREHAAEAYRAWLETDGLLPEPRDLALTVLDPATGEDLRETGDLAGSLAAGHFSRPVRWDLVTRALDARGAAWILDVGPGTGVAEVTARNLRGRGPHVLALASPEGRRRLATPGAAPAGPDTRYADFAPSVVELPDGTRRLDNRYVRATGQSPVILPGMTPTTSDAGIVAAAANAGFTAELAGAGQADATTFARRIVELRELLEPGVEVAFNTLLLDRHLWELHISREDLVLAARRAGAPLSGLTVSAGIPDVEDAIALLDRLVAHGMARNAFKPGTAEQVRQLLDLADAAPYHTIIVHLEGGKAGGHHSWEDLDELLLETYHELRRRPNVLLCVGGGIATPERATALLTGTWARAHDEPDMPVDGVLLGSVTMACAEATASPQVKQALVAADGSADWIARRANAGGVTSARSNLNADIHLLDNHAARVGILLEEVAGDDDAVTARREEIIDVLSRTAKPYFGDLHDLSYTAVLARFAELAATGRHGRYDDGAWGHVDWRARALDLYHRFAARLDPSDRGPIEPPVAVPGDLDDPAAALATFCARYPAAATTLLHPADAQYVLEVCDRPGKPVPFVPVVDREVRRWYMADALWQAQDDRLDAGAVIVIPGPDGVRGIERADEPVAELLGRFESDALATLLAGGVGVTLRDRLADGGVAPEPLRGIATGALGAIAALCVAPSIVGAEGARPNPLWGLVRPGDRIAREAGEDGTLTALRVTPRRGDRETVDLVLDGDDVLLTVATPRVDGGDDALTLRLRPLGGGAFAEVDGDLARAAYARAALLDGPAAAADDPFASVSRPWRLDAARLDGYRAVVGARHAGVPHDLAFSLGWPALAALLGTDGLAGAFGDLVHAGHVVVPGPAWPPVAGESGEAVARVVALEDPDGAPTGLTSEVVLTADRGELARVRADLLIRRDAPLGPWAELQRSEHHITLVLDAATAEVLGEQPWLDGAPAAGDEVRIRASTTQERDRDGRRRCTAEGTVEREGALVASISFDALGGSRHPVDTLLQALAPAAPERHAVPRRRLAEAEDVTPETADAFARIGGDRNPLHRSVLAARLAGLDEPIMHGAWTAARAGAFVVDELCAGDAARLRVWRVRFTAPLELGVPITLRAWRVARQNGALVVEVEVAAGGEVVALGEAVVAPARAALLFPGQGVQEQGLGAEGRARSRAARVVWDRADAHTRERLGWSLLDVVQDNPTELRLAGGEVVRHPGGVLFCTELTQPALVALAAAQVAELREAGALDDGAIVAAGHSVGEFGALVALGVLPLEAALELVHERGLAMQRHVPRDPEGRSAYGLCAVDPSRAGASLADLTAVVAEVASHTGELLEIVNHNAPDRQYAVAGTSGAIAALRERLGERAVRDVLGIDVPFHSSVLAPAVDDLRNALERLVGEVDGADLAGRWIPNLVGRPFALDDDFRATVSAVTGRPAPAEPRALVIELLAAQLAAPVRWVETQRALLAVVGVGRFVEVGPARGAVLTGLASRTVEATAVAGAGPELLHAERDRDAVLAQDEAVAPVIDEDSEEPPAPVPAAAPVAVSAAAAPVADRPLDAGTALRLVLAVQARVRPDQLRDDETIDELFQGVSSRRNQVLIDLGREFGLSGTEGSIDLPLGRLVEQLREQGTRYRFPGDYLRPTVDAGVARALGAARVSRGETVSRLETSWGLGEGLRDHVLATLALESREGPSARGGALGRLAGADDIIDRAVELAAAAHGFPAQRAVAAPVAESGGTPLDAATQSALLEAAQQVAAALGGPLLGTTELSTDDPDADRLTVLDAELGPERAQEIAPRFDVRRHVVLDGAGAFARWDLVTWFHAALDGDASDAELARIARFSGDPRVAATARWLAARARTRGREDVSAALTGGVTTIATDGAVSGHTPRDFTGETALVTGASPGSIAAAVVVELLRGGAKVVVSTSTETSERRRWYRELYRQAAAPGAELHLVPANLASFADVDALADWIAPLAPTIVAPFAAMPTVGDAADAGASGEAAIRLQLLGVERLVAGLGRAAARLPGRRPVTALLPLSPNQGGFGGDGAYGETKAGLEVLLRRWRSERDAWGRGIVPIGARIGWVRGTGLMGFNDPVADPVQEHLGIRTFSAEEMGGLLADALAAAPDDLVDLDLTGGLGDVPDLRGAVQPLADALRAQAEVTAARDELRALLAEPEREPFTVLALPNPETDAQGPDAVPLDTPLEPADLVVLVGTGELGPAGTARTRFELETAGPGALSAAAVGELAWLCGLVTFHREGYRGTFADADTGEDIAEHELASRYGEKVAARVGLRLLHDDGVIDPVGRQVLTAVGAVGDVRFEVPDEATARSFLVADPDATRILQDPATGAWQVIRRGGELRVPRVLAPARRVAGQFPDGLDLARLGVPGDLLTTADRLALVNLACTDAAFASAGLTPEELLAHVHPALVANTQGAGMGGMLSLRHMLFDTLLDGERQPDRLQEALGNVFAAHVVQGYVGSYGAMVHPVAACATAAVSLEEAHDKIRAGKALAVLAGGFDDLTPEGMRGFADMHATADSDALDAAGIAPHEASRPGDRRRQGFVESQGGGALLAVRGDIALELGLPVQAVLLYAGSFADGIHSSIPASGLGALAAGMGGADSPLATALRRHGLDADDIGVVSKHDTSTEMNDPNEADLHERLATALGRTPGNPLLVVSQKSVTGHSKGGAAAWQVSGLSQILSSGMIPGNRNLEAPDPLVLQGEHLAVGDRPLRLAEGERLRAGLVTSLGFGHVSAVVALGHPDVFLGAVPEAERASYLRQAGRRAAVGEQRRLRRVLGDAPELRRSDRRLGEDHPVRAREAEAAALLDPSTRLRAGVLRPGPERER
ncbi:MAG: DUF1729 domain-containing protein [Solirubrobacteraceae bacterium]|nr:DUF1729 domain-containing protein [Solirubrobacteraceae bacterium]